MIATYALPLQMETVPLILSHAIYTLYLGWIRKRNLWNLSPVECNIVELYFVTTPYRYLHIGGNLFSVNKSPVFTAAVGKEDVSIVQKQNFGMI